MVGPGCSRMPSGGQGWISFEPPSAHPPFLLKKMKTSKIVAILVLALLLGAVVIQNRQPVETRFLMVTVTMPQILLLLITVGGGFCLGLLVAIGVRGKSKSGTH